MEWVLGTAFLVILFLLLLMILNLMNGNRKNQLLMKKMEDNEKTLMEAIGYSTIKLWVYYPDENKMVIDRKFAEETGLPRVIYNWSKDYICRGIESKEEIDKLKNTFERVEKGEDTGECDVRFHIQGEDHWYRIRMFASYDEKGQRSKIIGTSFCIDAQKKVEKLYLEQLRFSNDINDDNLIAKGRYNLNTNTVEYYIPRSQSALALSEIDSYDGFVTKVSALAVHQEDRSQIERMFQREVLIREFTEGITTVSYEYQRRREEQDTIWTSTRIRTFQHPETEELVAFSYTYDITPIVMEQNIISQITNFEYDYLAILYMKKGTFKMYKIKKGEEDTIVYRYKDYRMGMEEMIPKIVPPEEQEYALEATKLETIRKHLDEEGSYQCMFGIQEADGSRRQKKLQYCYLDDTRETVLISRSDVTDVYEQEQMQLEKLSHALGDAKKASLAKTEFLSRMSHDIRTPMNGIIGLTTLAKDELDHPEVMLDYLNKIDSSSQFLLGLINDILDMTKIESGSVTIKREPYPLEEMLKEIDTLIRPLCYSKDVNFEIKTEDLVCDCVQFDKLRMNQILFNLLSNAVKFTPPGGKVTFVIRHIARKDSIVKIQFIVRDNGIGIGDEFKKHIFEPFSQEKQTEEILGTGLGLAIVKNLVSLMGGEITVESETGHGSEFVVELETEVCTNPAKKEEQEADIDDSLLKGKKVLLCEDHPINMQIAKRLLEKKGMIVTCAKNGLEGVKKFEEGPEGAYDVVLMDILMPVMDGLEATRKIRAIDRTDAKLTPIIAMTANAFQEDVRKSLEAGMNGHLAKPVDHVELFRTLKCCIKI